MDWLMNFLSPRAVLVVWVDAQKPAANDSLRASVTKRGFDDPDLTQEVTRRL